MVKVRLVILSLLRNYTVHTKHDQSQPANISAAEVLNFYRQDEYYYDSRESLQKKQLLFLNFLLLEKLLWEHLLLQ